MAHIIVVGNEKGGSGKSTTTMHLATALARMGHSVGGLDLDLRQRSFGRYVENRAAFCARAGHVLPSPHYLPLPQLATGQVPEGENGYDMRLDAAVRALEPDHEFILIDCPGAHTRLSQLAHALADTLVTPLNDSFVDFDLLARQDPGSGRLTTPSVYAEMVDEARRLRARAGLGPIDWLVIRNRMGRTQIRNRQRVGEALRQLSRRIGFRTAPGFAERVIFRELFPRGLTLLDLRDVGGSGLTLPNIAARQELRELINALDLPGVRADF